MIDGNQTMDELKALIVAKLDVLEFLDILGYDVADLVEVLEDEIEENQQELERACR
jgi:hypothetical protein